MFDKFRDGTFSLGLIIGIAIVLVPVSYWFMLAHDNHSSRQHYSGVLTDNKNQPNSLQERAFGPNAGPNFQAPNSPEHPKYYEHYDLRAQESMAESTEAIKKLTIWSIGIGIVGTGLLLFTLYETRRATNLSRESAEKQLRAYVMIIHGAQFTPIASGEHVTATIQIKNCGQTPAYDLRMLRAVVVRPLPDPGIFDDPETGAFRLPGELRQPMAAGDLKPITCKSLFPLSQEEFDGVRNGTMAVFINGRLVYRDAFGEPQKTNFRLVHGGPRAPKANQLGVWPEGNDAT